MIEPPPTTTNAFSWIWAKWLYNLWDYIFFSERNVTVTTTSYNAGSEHVVYVDDDTAGGVVTITLPLAQSGKRHLHVKKLGTTANVIVDGNGSETIDGAANATLTAQYENVTVSSNGSAWFIL